MADVLSPLDEADVPAQRDVALPGVSQGKFEDVQFEDVLDDAMRDSYLEQLGLEQLGAYVEQLHSDEHWRRTGRPAGRLQIKIPRHVEDAVLDRLALAAVECDEDGEYFAEETLDAALTYASQLIRKKPQVVRAPLRSNRCRSRPRGRRVRRSARSPGRPDSDPEPEPDLSSARLAAGGFGAVRGLR